MKWIRMDTKNHKLGLLDMARKLPIYISGNDILIALSSNRPETLVPICSLSAWFKAFARKIPPPPTTNNNLQRLIPPLRFCICQLIPYLKFLNTGVLEEYAISPGIERAIANIEDRAKNLPQPKTVSVNDTVALELLQEYFCVPCQVTSTQVVPLQPVQDTASKASDITISGIRLRRRYRIARPLNRVITEIEGIAKAKLYMNPHFQSQMKSSASAILDDVNRYVKLWFNPKPNPLFWMIYEDRNHKLMYQNGYFVLARGPLKALNNTKKHTLPIFLGLPIIGARREGWLASSPVYSNSLNGFWLKDGKPNPRGRCMGKNPNQFRRLKSSFFTDEEALVEWIDAGAIITTGVPLFHRRTLNPQSLTARTRQSMPLPVRRNFGK